MDTQTPDALALFNDFGTGGIYTGQLKLRLSASGIVQPVIDLLTDAPAFNPKASAYLLASQAAYAPANTLFLAVVDPGVGSERLPLVIRVGTLWYVGPDNGLFSQVIKHSAAKIRSISWRPERLSVSFHGRDLFTPVAIALCRGEEVPGEPVSSTTLVGHDWPEDLYQVIYLDHFGNAFTGIRGSTMTGTETIQAGSTLFTYAKVFSSVPVGSPFWYVNSCGLVELAVNQGSAAQRFGLAPGDALTIV